MASIVVAGCGGRVPSLANDCGQTFTVTQPEGAFTDPTLTGGTPFIKLDV